MTSKESLVGRSVLLKGIRGGTEGENAVLKFIENVTGAKAVAVSQLEEHLCEERKPTWIVLLQSHDVQKNILLSSRVTDFHFGDGTVKIKVDPCSLCVIPDEWTVMDEQSHDQVSEMEVQDDPDDESNMFGDRSSEEKGAVVETSGNKKDGPNILQHEREMQGRFSSQMPLEPPLSGNFPVDEQEQTQDENCTEKVNPQEQDCSQPHQITTDQKGVSNIGSAPPDSLQGQPPYGPDFTHGKYMAFPDQQGQLGQQGYQQDGQQLMNPSEGHTQSYQHYPQGQPGQQGYPHDGQQPMNPPGKHGQSYQDPSQGQISQQSYPHGGQWSMNPPGHSQSYQHPPQSQTTQQGYSHEGQQPGNPPREHGQSYQHSPQSWAAQQRYHYTHGDQQYMNPAEGHGQQQLPFFYPSSYHHQYQDPHLMDYQQSVRPNMHSLRATRFNQPPLSQFDSMNPYGYGNRFLSPQMFTEQGQMWTSGQDLSGQDVRPQKHTSFPPVSTASPKSTSSETKMHESPPPPHSIFQEDDLPVKRDPSADITVQASPEEQELSDPDYSTADESSEMDKNLAVLHVKDLPRDASDETLTLYFENKRKSGGGDVKLVEMNTKDNSALVHFDDPQVAKRVVEKTPHCFLGTEIQVSFHLTDEDDHESDDESDTDNHPSILEVKRLPPSITEDALRFYFENRRKSGGGDLESVEFDPSTHSALLHFEDPEAVDRVIQRAPHLISKKQIEVSAYAPDKLPPRPMDEEEFKPDLRTVEVRGFRAETSDDTFQFYFENHRKGGGDIEEFKKDEEDDVIYITFKSEEVAKRVAARPHKIDGHDLDVKVYIPPPPPKPKPTYEDKLLITGLNDTTTKDCLINFLEAKTQCTPEDLKYGEEPGVVVVTFEEIPDIETLQEACRKRPLEKAFLTVSKVPISDCILVQDLASATTEDTIQFYFESKRSGNTEGVDVEKIDLKPEEGYCLVYFEDHTVTDKILKKKDHTLDKVKLKLSLYHECLGLSGGASDPFWFKIPDPLEIQQVDEYKIRFVQNSKVALGALNKQLGKTFAKVNWSQAVPDLVILECTLAKEVQDCQKLVKTWKKDAEESWKQFMDVLLVEKLSILMHIWDEVEINIKSVKISHPEGATMYIEKDLYTIVVVGMPVASSVVNQVKKLVKEVEEEHERKRQEITEPVYKLKPIQLRLLLAVGFPQKMVNKYKGLHVTIKLQKNEVLFVGQLQDVKKAQVDMYELINSVCTSKITMSDTQMQMVEKDSVRKHIVRKLKVKNLIGVWEVNQGEVIVYSLSDPEAVNVIQAVKQSVVEHVEQLQQESLALLTSSGWSDLTGNLLKTNGDMLNIAVKVNKSQIVIVGTDDIIYGVIEDVHNFCRENTIYEEKLKFPRGVQRFLQLHCSAKITHFTKKLSSCFVEILFHSAGTEFTIKGTECGMKTALQNMDNLSEKVQHREHVLKKPGIGKFINSDKGTQLISLIEKTENCVVEKTFDSSEKVNVGSHPEKQFSPGGDFKILATCDMASGRKLLFMVGNMALLKVDVIVNAANKQLDHIGGLAGVIVDKGGKEIQDECRAYVSKQGEVLPGEVATSGPGKLSCKMIVHAVGPNWSGGSRGEEDLLREAIFNSLEATHKHNLTSIAIPALSSGIFGYPVELATQTIIEAVQVHYKDLPDSRVREVYLTDVKMSTVQLFIKAAKKVFGDINVREQQSGAVPSQTYQQISHAHRRFPASPKQRQSSSPPMASAVTSGSSSIKISLVKGEIAQEKVDVIVNTTATSLDLTNGAVSKSILKAGGMKLQAECRQKYPNGIKLGDFAVTRSGGSLQCQNVFHSCLPNWSSDPTTEQMLRNLVQKCLKKTEKGNYCSIAFPALGTGNLGYPRDLVAQCMYEEINDFGQASPNTSVQEVKIVVYHLDSATIKAFEDQASKISTRTSGETRSRRKNRKFNATPGKTFIPKSKASGGNPHDEWEYVSRSDIGLSFQIGPITLSIKQGDITKESTDCIVNSTNELLDLSMGAVSKAIVSACGTGILKECSLKRDEMKKSGVVTTTAKGLNCNFIIHVNTDHFQSWKKVVLKCLKTAEKLPGNLQSIAFPALGTGQSRITPEGVADAFLDAVVDFQKSGPTTLQDIQVVIFQQDMLHPFASQIHKTISKKKSSGKGFFKTIRDFISGEDGTEGNVYPASFQHGGNTGSTDSSEITLYFYSDTTSSIEKAITKLEESCGDQVLDEVMVDPILKELTPSQISDIKNLKSRFDVQVDLNVRIGRVRFQGMTKDVMSAREAVHQIIRDVERMQMEQEKAEILANLVQWHYITTDKSGNEDPQEYDKTTNGIIEKAYKEGKPTVSLKADDGTYVIDFNSMTEYLKNDASDSIQVVRKDLIKAASRFEPPATWSLMGPDDNLLVIPIQTSDQEYTDVSQKFLSTLQIASGQVIKIERIQNRTLYQQYIAKKDLLNRQNAGQSQNERQLWHGTSQDAIASINTHGFNRSYCGKNATAYGDGVYFAVGTRYSAQNAYSRPDAQGHKYMYLAQVLTGEYTQGKHGMRVPPVKSSGQPHLLYDSVVDNPNAPGMFIIFNDTQAYPEYLVSFTV